MFDKQSVQSIGSIAIDPSNHDTIWVGTGEAWTRNSVSVGDGIYKSIDGGDTWTNMGLRNSERIAKIMIDPRDGNTVYACVPGKLWSDSPDRGLYKTSDGGKNWSLVLKGGNLSTGCSSISLDPKDPNVVFAALWDFRRKGWTFRSGGESAAQPSGSGLFRSADGGRFVDRSHRHREQGLPEETVRTHRGRGRAVRVEHRLRVRRIDRFGAVPLRRRRQDLGQARQEPDDGLASVLLRAT